MLTYLTLFVVISISFSLLSYISDVCSDIEAKKKNKEAVKRLEELINKKDIR